MFQKLGTTNINVHHKRNKMTPLVLLPQQHFQLQSLSVKKNKYRLFQPLGSRTNTFRNTTCTKAIRRVLMQCQQFRWHRKWRRPTIGAFKKTRLKKYLKYRKGTTFLTVKMRFLNDLLNKKQQQKRNNYRAQYSAVSSCFGPSSLQSRTTKSHIISGHISLDFVV